MSQDAQVLFPYPINYLLHDLKQVIFRPVSLPNLSDALADLTDPFMSMIKVFYIRQVVLSTASL